MIKFFRRRLIPILLIVFVVFSVAEVFANTTQKNPELIQPPIKITEAFKNIPYNPNTARDREDIDQGKLRKDITLEQRRILHNSNTTQEQDINEFAWKDFVALNWPANCQGEPLDQLIGQVPEAPRVWELYPSPKDVFLPNGKTPPSRDNLPEDKKCLGDRKGSEIQYKQTLRLTETGNEVGEEEFGEVKTANSNELLDGYGELKNDKLLKEIDAANQIPLVDRQKNYVINEIRMNPGEFKQIIENKWFDATNLVSFNNNRFQLVCSEGNNTDNSKRYCNTKEKEGAIEIKVAWRVFDQRNSEQEKARYYTTKRKIVGKMGEILNEEAELGMIGFHIMHKTSQLGWIWSTFEHVDNAPPCSNPEATPYTLYSKECNTQNNCKENSPYVKPPYLWRISNDKPKAVTMEGIVVKEQDTIPSIEDQIPSQICRSNLIRTSADNKNQDWHKLLKAVSDSSVWQYYQLIGTQWLQNPQNRYLNDDKTGKRRRITPKTPLANVTIEPYTQKVSCILCHTSAHLPGKGNSCELNAEDKGDQMKACADFSFLMNDTQFSKELTTNLN